jgi:nucleoid DNA-binding protein
VTKKDIVRTISEEVGLTQQQTKEIVQKTFDAIVESLVRERRIELRNFGVFEVKPRAARMARNPRTGQQVEVPSKFVVTFKPGKTMEARMNELDESEMSGLEPNEDNAGKTIGSNQQTKSIPGGLPPTEPQRLTTDQNRSSQSPPRPSGRWDAE